MRYSPVTRLALGLGLAVLLTWACVTPAPAQDPNLPPTYGWVQLYSGFLPDPYARSVVAGGELYTWIGGVNAHVARAPDFQLYYTAGRYPLTIWASSASDTTLLVRLPSGLWVANDDGAGNLNPMIRLSYPESGRYDIWVGTYNPGYPPATLYITELQ